MQVANVVNGRHRPSVDMTNLLSPATLAMVGEAPVSTTDDLDAAVAAASGALGGEWADEKARCRALAAAADLIEAETDALERLLSLEQGKVLPTARVEVAISILRHYAGWRDRRRVIRDLPHERIFCDRIPVGIAALIMPWNYPLTILFMKLGPAPWAGNAVVVKPAPTTPLTTLHLATLLSAVLPAGVVNTVAEGARVGQALAGHAGIAKVSFTGSTTTGRAVMAEAAPTLKRLTLELGGNDAAIVLRDADVSRMAQRLYASPFSNAGQVCAAVKRVYVDRAIHDDLVAALEAIAQSVVVGEGLSYSAQMGPVHSAAQRDFVQSLTDGARAAGARVFDAGPPLPDLPGHFLRPAIVSGLDPGSDLVMREQFGPALPVIPVDDPGTAVKMSNASEYGLGASVWSADPDEALTLARRLEAGSLYINARALPPDPAVPFGGVKQSGLGYELGDWGIDEFSLRRVIRVEALPQGTA